MSQKIRVRFAPSPTGPLHIGGVRTALYNYLFAKKHNGVFCLRIEDTDQARYVAGAEDYIKETLGWLGLVPDEGPGYGGDFGPYRQSERKDIYLKYAQELLKRGKAYYAFDTPEELDARRKMEAERGNHSFKYDAHSRKEMKNSLTLSEEEVQKRISAGEPYVIRLLVPENDTVTFEDLVRGQVTFETSELDDKVLIKADGMPTYHMANIVDDHLMEISHVIRGEEWLPSTGHHVLLYKAFGWGDSIPHFAHLPLILKPNGKGKLSKRDGAKFGIPVFPLDWKGEGEDDHYPGFREYGFLPEAVINFLAFLGWNPGTDEELFSLDQLCQVFSLDKIHKGGARFDYEKARWYNQQYIQRTDDGKLASLVRPIVEAKGFSPDDGFLTKVCGLLKERCQVLPDFWENGFWFFDEVKEYDTDNVKKRWTPELKGHFEKLIARLAEAETFETPELESMVKAFINDNGLKMGQVLPLLRIALAGTMKGPGVFETMEVFGKEETLKRLKKALAAFDDIAEA
ncbi:MAG: glutamate--tRNA ligase [Saprospirales bacterium]|nr:glutamate--tRNA ligase [Saprospirales bacterium]